PTIAGGKTIKRPISSDQGRHRCLSGLVHFSRSPSSPMPVIPPGLSEWLALLTQPAVILVGVGLIVNQQNRLIDALRDSMNKRIDDMNKRIDNLQGDVKEIQKDVKELLLRQAATTPR
ncbi:MAG: hypothetical protein OXE74_08360, partial [Cyanobacteria bacterium MAG CAR2_bin_4]|nr:hypothetical protein [Cyanobacteria bacterium MAG CAR2_bin_4]